MRQLLLATAAIAVGIPWSLGAQTLPVFNTSQPFSVKDLFATGALVRAGDQDYICGLTTQADRFVLERCRPILTQPDGLDQEVAKISDTGDQGAGGQGTGDGGTGDVVDAPQTAGFQVAIPQPEQGGNAQAPAQAPAATPAKIRDTSASDAGDAADSSPAPERPAARANTRFANKSLIDIRQQITADEQQKSQAQDLLANLETFYGAEDSTAKTEFRATLEQQIQDLETKISDGYAVLENIANLMKFRALIAKGVPRFQTQLDDRTAAATEIWEAEAKRILTEYHHNLDGACVVNSEDARRLLLRNENWIVDAQLQIFDLNEGQRNLMLGVYAYNRFHAGRGNYYALGDGYYTAAMVAADSNMGDISDQARATAARVEPAFDPLNQPPIANYDAVISPLDDGVNARLNIDECAL